MNLSQAEIKADKNIQPICSICNSVNSRKMYPSEISSSSDVSFAYTFSPSHCKTFQVMRCLNCTHVFCSPVPPNIGENYKDVVDVEYLKHSQSRKFAFKAVLQSIKKYRASGKFLDIGCATGDLLEVAREHGYQAEGLEISDWSSKLASGLGIKIHKEYLDTFVSKHRGEFDVIALMGVIEHFSQPDEEMSRIAQLLAPGGILVIWTGDVDSITSKLMGRKWWYWQSQHIQYFTHSSLKRLTTKNNLEYVTTKLFPFGASFDTLSNSLRRYRSQKLLKTIIRPLFYLRSIWHLRVPGEMLMIVKSKNSE